MSTSGETADLVVKESIQITESAVKLAGLGAKNLAALLIAIAKDNPKLAGKTGLKRLIQDGEELTIFSIKQDDLKGFQMESKRYGVLFYPIVNKVEKTGTVEIMAKAKDAKQINRIFERMAHWTARFPNAIIPCLFHVGKVYLPIFLGFLSALKIPYRAYPVHPHPGPRSIPAAAAR